MTETAIQALTSGFTLLRQLEFRVPDVFSQAGEEALRQAVRVLRARGVDCDVSNGELAY
jgi:hypothetical protein